MGRCCNFDKGKVKRRANVTFFVLERKTERAFGVHFLDAPDKQLLPLLTAPSLPRQCLMTLFGAPICSSVHAGQLKSRSATLDIFHRKAQATNHQIHGWLETSSRWLECCQQKRSHDVHALKSSKNRVDLLVITETLVAPLLGQLGGRFRKESRYFGDRGDGPRSNAGDGRSGGRDCRRIVTI